MSTAGQPGQELGWRAGNPVDALFSPGVPRHMKAIAAAIMAAAVLLIFFHLYTAMFTALHPWVQRHFAVTVILIIGFLLRPMGRKSWRSPLNSWFLVDLVFIAMAIAPFIMVLAELPRWSMGVLKLTATELVLGSAFIVAVLEMTRRVVGWPMVAIALFFVLANAYANHLPRPFFGPPVQWNEQISMVYAEMYGMFSIPVAVITDFLVVFFLFAALLAGSVSGQVVINLAMSLVGRFSGGPAKAAVVGSSIFGTVSGSPMANVMAVGSFTIPMMKKMGFSPVMAGAVEGAASTGGQFVPPIMGVVAFMMPSFLGITYLSVCLAAIVPASLYYLGVFMQVHLEGKKLHIEGLPPSELPRLWSAMKPAWILAAPVAGIFYFLFQGYGLGKVALYGIVLMLVCTFISRKKPGMSSRAMMNAIYEAANMSVTAGAACASAGIIIGVFYTSGLGDKLSLAIVSLAGGSVWIALILTAIVCIILGMGIPTPAIYITMVLTTIPALIKLGVLPLAAHFFTFFMGVTSGLTPPVALTAFVAGSLAGANMMRTGIVAFRLAIVGFITAFVFTARPELLLVGQPASIVYWIAMASLGTVALSIAFERYLVSKLNWLGMLLFLAAGLALWWPYSVPVNIGGVALFVILVSIYVVRRRKPLTSPSKPP